MENNRPKFTQSIAAKMGAFLLCVFLTAAMTLSIFGIVICYATGAYDVSRKEVKDEFLSSMLYSTVYELTDNYIYGGEEALAGQVEGTNLSYCVTDPEGNVICGEQRSEKDYYSARNEIHGDDFEVYQNGEAGSNNTLEIYLDKSVPASDRFQLADKIIELLYTMRYWLYAWTLISLVEAIICFIFLMCSAGHRKDYEGIYAGPMTKIWFDVFTLAVAGIIVFILYMCNEMADQGRIDVAVLMGLSIAVAAGFCVLLGWCVDFAARIKLGKWWRNTLIYKLLNLIWKLLKLTGRGIGGFFKNLPLIWKTVLFMVALGIFALIAIGYDDYSSRATAVLLVGIVVFALVCYIAVTLRKLQSAGEKIAQGDLDYRVDTGKMFGDFKQHGEALNSIGSGMTLAVDERLKSERLKTELITNVSHDIKTPLTSIINYTDLISKEQSDNEKITEYTAVLARQSARLKKLIEDLVEASKASTGNVEVHFAPCDVGVMLEQTAAEYEEKIKASALELIISKPEGPVMISADGRLLWRVLDNLMNNICKYTQPDTRVYAGLEQRDGRAVITFKNISRCALNISADELMERFVRGDSSRHTEGSGLGLNIAKSLTELQNGELKLQIDGDLFKVELSFEAAS